MKKTIAFIALIIFAFPVTTMARGVKRVGDSSPEIQLSSEAPEQEEADSAPVDCHFSAPAKPQYSAEFLAIRKKAFVAKKELFETKVFILNTGNVPWFSAKSGCNTSVTNLGTDKDRDRQSPFFVDHLMWKSNWTSANRIVMDTKRVDPQQIATFTYWSQAPDKDGLFREFLTPVVEGKSWVDSGTFSTDIKVGEPNIDPEKKELLSYIQKSTNLAEVDLKGEKNIEVDISEQKMWIKIGDTVIKEFPVSTGTSKTPTPVGTTKILEKMEVRVASKKPHYIMPKWMAYRSGGYGIHALPSLGNDGGVFWREALNHIGSRRSHGCIRLLPKDAEWAYNFTDVGTKVVVHH